MNFEQPELYSSEQDWQAHYQFIPQVGDNVLFVQPGQTYTSNFSITIC